MARGGQRLGDERSRLGAVRGVAGDADSGHEMERLPSQLPGDVEELHEARREAEDLRQVLHPRHDDREEVAADVGERVGLAREDAEAISDHGGELLAGLEAEGGAHLGRLVEVDDDEGDELLVALCLGEGHREAIGEQGAVGQTREDVEARERRELLSLAARKGRSAHLAYTYLSGRQFLLPQERYRPPAPLSEARVPSGARPTPTPGSWTQAIAFALGTPSPALGSAADGEVRAAGEVATEHERTAGRGAVAVVTLGRAALQDVSHRAAADAGERGEADRDDGGAGLAQTSLVEASHQHRRQREMVKADIWVVHHTCLVAPWIPDAEHRPANRNLNPSCSLVSDFVIPGFSWTAGGGAAEYFEHHGRSVLAASGDTLHLLVYVDEGREGRLREVPAVK